MAGLRKEGFDVVADRSLGHTSNLAVGRIEPSRVASEALELLENAGRIDALVIACTNLRALEARDELTSETSAKVVTSNSAGR